MWFSALFIFFIPLSDSLRVVDNPGQTMEMELQTDSGPVTLIVGKKKGRSVGVYVPKPFEVTSKLMSVVDGAVENPRYGRRVQKVSRDKDGIIVIDGVREPDDPNDTRVFRNARVINNVLIPDALNSENQIEDFKPMNNNFNNIRFFRREGRILTGFPDDADAETKTEDKKFIGESGSNSYRQFSAYNSNYNPDRSGVSQDSETKAKNVNSQQKAASYSFSVSSNENQKISPKQNVVYGAGFATNARQKVTLQPSPTDTLPSYYFPQTKNSPYSPNLTSQRNNLLAHYYKQQAERKILRNDSPNVKFPAGDIKQQHSNPSPVHVSNPFASNPVKQVHTLEQNSLPSQFQLTNQQFLPSWAGHPSQIQQQQPKQTIPPNKVLYSQLSPPSAAPNHIRRNHQIQRHQANNIPTPQHVFKGSGSVHPGLIPANPQDFVIEKQTFQAHPGAPVFSVPVPRPTSQAHQLATFQHPHQQHYQHQYLPQTYPGYSPSYPHYLNRRPLIDRVMDPFKRIGQRVREASQQFGTSLRIPERMDKLASGTVDADAVPLVGGALAVATIGALGAYAASKYTFNDFRKLLPTIAARSSKKEISTTLLKLAEDLEKEDPAFIKEVIPSMKWLESSCSKKMFCSIVTATIKEEEELLRKRLSEEQKKKTGSEPTGRSLLNEVKAKELRKNETKYFEDHINQLLDRFRGKTPKKSGELKDSAKRVMKAIREGSCEVFECSEH